MDKRHVWPWRQVMGRRTLCSACWIWIACLLPLPAWGRSPTPEELRRQAEQAEARGDWLQACAFYEQLPARHRNRAEVRQRYLLCMRHAHRLRRHRDATYRQQAEQLTLTHALALYEEVLNKLQVTYLDPSRVAPGRLFHYGLEELGFALADPEFCRTYLTASLDMVRDFQQQLATQWGDRPIRRSREAAHEAGLLAQSAEEALGVQPVLIVLELTCGACTALDEYTVYLPSGRFTEVAASLKGEAIGIGLDVVVGDRKLVITQVLPGSPAEMAGLKPGDWILRLGGKDAQDLTAEAATALLAGELGTMVELVVQAREELGPRLLVLPRQVVHVPSVSAPRFASNPAEGIGYLHLLAFHESTPQELDSALRDLQAGGMKTLILDLRGNPGGVLPAALEVVKRFVADGVIASTRGRAQVREHNKKYEVHGGQALTVGLIVLVDGSTASVAELVAGALKDHERATLVGQPTFGKGLLQKVRPLSTTPAGLQITVARFFSPLGRGYDRIGVEPHVQVNRTPPATALDMSEDMQLTAAVEVARGMGR